MKKKQFSDEGSTTSPNWWLRCICFICSELYSTLFLTTRKTLSVLAVWVGSGSDPAISIFVVIDVICCIDCCGTPTLTASNSWE